MTDNQIIRPLFDLIRSLISGAILGLCLAISVVAILLLALGVLYGVNP